MNRRALLRSLVAGMAIPLAPIGIASAAQRTGRRLILVELSGANDGLNTVIPINDKRYFEIRPNIALSKEKSSFEASLNSKRQYRQIAIYLQQRL